jgi:hypothetical protein
MVIMRQEAPGKNTCARQDTTAKIKPNPLHVMSELTTINMAKISRLTAQHALTAFTARKVPRSRCNALQVPTASKALCQTKARQRLVFVRQANTQAVRQHHKIQTAETVPQDITALKAIRSRFHAQLENTILLSEKVQSLIVLMQMQITFSRGSVTQEVSHQSNVHMEAFVQLEQLHLTRLSAPMENMPTRHHFLRQAVVRIVQQAMHVQVVQVYTANPCFNAMLATTVSREALQFNRQNAQLASIQIKKG